MNKPIVALITLFVLASPTYAVRSAVRKSSPHPASVQNNAAVNAYLGRLRAKLVKEWLIPDGKNNVTVSVDLNSDGTIITSTTKSNPSNANAEQAANEAFAKVQPLETLPSGIPKAKIDLVFTSSADPHGASSSNVITQFTSSSPKSATKPGPGGQNSPASQSSNAAADNTGK